MGPSFIAEEFIEGQRLSVVWPELTEEQKSNIIREIANVLADLGETRFQSIGGLALDSPAGPTIEAAKIFDGRVRMATSRNSLFNLATLLKDLWILLTIITPQERFTVNSLPNLEVGPAAFGGTFSWEIFLMVLQKFRLLVEYLPF